jgi:TolA-binding protein
MNILKRAFLAILLICVLSSRAIAANDAIRVGVARFGSKAEGITDEHAAIISDLFSFELTQAKSLTVYERDSIDKIGRELKFDMSGLVDPLTAAEIGKIGGLQYMLLGAVTQVDQRASGGGFGGIVIGEREMNAVVDVRVVEVATAEVKMALRAEGNSKNQTAGISWNGFTFMQSEIGGIQARAIADAVTKLSNDVRNTLGGEFSRVVAEMGGGEFAINVSAPKEGALYLVYADGRTIYDMDGSYLGQDKIPIAVLKVTDINIGHSVAVIAPQGGKKENVRRGDKIEPISSGKAKELITKIPKERPRVSNMSELIFGNNGGPMIPPIANSPPSEYIPPRGDIGGEPEDEAGVPEPAAPPVKTQSPNNAQRNVAGVDPDNTTDAKLIDTYPLSSRDRNMLGIQQRSAFKLYSQKKYKDALAAFSALAEQYDCNYLSAYWAGMAALKAKDNAKAAEFFDLALSRNPNYQPALKEKEKLEKARKK